MAKRLITTVGGAYSNSYVTLEEADLIAVNFPWYDKWDAYDDEEKIQALIQAAFAMQQLPWDGEKCSPASDAGKEATNWDQYWLDSGDNENGGAFDYFFYNGRRRSQNVTTKSLNWGKDNASIFTGVSELRVRWNNTDISFFDPSDTEVTPDSSRGIEFTPGVDGLYSDREFIFYFDTPFSLSRIQGDTSVDPLAPQKRGYIYSIWVNGTQLFNFPGTKSTQAQRLAWPRSGVTCDGEEADCTYIPETIKITQVILAYNFLENPSDVPGTPGSGNEAPAGTFIKRQKIDVLEIEYDQYNSNQFNADCNDCDDPYLIRIYPWLKDLLGCWLEVNSSSNNRLIRLFRN